jgi:hypothetical protein
MTTLSPVSTEALQQARDFANEILHPPETQAAAVPAPSTVVVHHYYPDYYWYRPVYPSGGYCCPTLPCSSGKSKDEKDGVAAIVAVAGLVVLGTSYFIGTEIGRLSEAEGRKQTVEWRKTALAHSKEEEAPRVAEVLDLQKSMLDSMKSEAWTGIATKAALVASAILTAYGALAENPSLQAGGLVGGLFSGSAMLVRWGYGDADTALKEDAMRLLTASKSIQV